MSGGIAYVYDTDQQFATNCNMGMVELESCDEEDKLLLQGMLEKHMQLKQSTVAVSYTHLDVYKRQLKTCMKSLRPWPCKAKSHSAPWEQIHRWLSLAISHNT